MVLKSARCTVVMLTPPERSRGAFVSCVLGIDLNASISSDRHLTAVACKQKRTQPNRLNPFHTAGARDENRTRTPIRARDFKSLASTSSATQAPLVFLRLYIIISENANKIIFNYPFKIINQSPCFYYRDRLVCLVTSRYH